jgi:hypothetical protein
MLVRVVVADTVVAVICIEFQGTSVVIQLVSVTARPHHRDDSVDRK